MARVVVTADDFEAGDLPAVCARTGRHAEGMSPFRASDVPLWPLLLLPWGFLPVIVAEVFGSRRLDGWLPTSDATVARDAFWRAVQLAFLVVAGCFAALGVVTEEQGLLVIAVVPGVAALGTAVFRAFTTVDPKLHRSGRWVVLSSVHEAFVAAVAAEGRAVRLPQARPWWRAPRRVDRPRAHT